MLITPGDLDFGGAGTAIESGDRSVSWPELGEMVAEAEAQLAGGGVTAGVRVMVRTALSLDHVVLLLALLRSRAVAIPLGDVEDGPYLDQLRRVAGAHLEVSADGALLRRDPGATDAEVMPPGPAAAAIHFTSGSTGAPKGVITSREGLAARLTWGVQQFFSTEVVRCAARCNPAFIDGLTEVLGALHADRTLVIAPPKAVQDLGALGRFLADRQVEQVTITPSCLPVLSLDPATALPSIRRWVLSGEPLRIRWARLARRMSPEAEIINSYGSTEVAGDVAFFRLRADEPLPDPIPIGDPVTGVFWHVEDRGDGAGELLIGGPQVALGYLDGADRPTPAFFAGPEGGDASADAIRWFRTGDIVRPEPEGWVFVGRVDGVRNVRGRRVDPAAAECLIDALPSVDGVAVSVADSPDGSARLEAFVVPAGSVGGSVASIRAEVRASSPAHLVPDVFVLVDALPRTPSGKIDRVALASARARSSAPDPADYASDLELAIALIVGGLDTGVRPDRTSPFAALGVDSLQLVQIAADLTEVVGIEISVADLVDWESIEGTAAHILGAAADDDRTCLRRLRVAHPDRVLLLLPPAIGTGLCYFRLLPHIDEDVTVVAVEETPTAVRALGAGGLAAWAELIASDVLGAHPRATVSVLGWSFGALLAPYCQHELVRSGVVVDRLILIDPAQDPVAIASRSDDWALRRILTDFEYGDRLPTQVVDLDAAMHLVRQGPGLLRQIHPRTLGRWAATMGANVEALASASPPRPTVPTLVIRGARTMASLSYPPWLAASASDDGLLRIVDLDATHFDLIRSSTVHEVGALVNGFSGAVT